MVEVDYRKSVKSYLLILFSIFQSLSKVLQYDFDEVNYHLDKRKFFWCSYV